MNRKSTIEYTLRHNISTVWRVVIDNNNYAWRSDVMRIEILSPTDFIEYYKDGGQTEFKIVTKRQKSHYQFAMKNKIFTGKWVGEFIEVDENTTKLFFTEDINFKNPLFYILSFFMINLKTLQLAYMKDLEKELKNEN